MAGRAATPKGRKLGNINNMPNRRYLPSINFSVLFARWSHFYVSIDWTITFIIRFVHHNKNTNIAQIHEHILGFCSIDDTTGWGLHEFILNHLQSLNLDISNLGGQGYDNGANMRGKHNGHQQKII
jgi:hypothetical protein